jgi:hypothetical protein
MAAIVESALQYDGEGLEMVGEWNENALGRSRVVGGSLIQYVEKRKGAPLY